MILWGNTLYGTTQYGGLGTGSAGSVFAVNTDGGGYTNLHTFNLYSDHGAVAGSLILSGNTLYGACAFGSVFSITVPVSPQPVPPPQLTMVLSGGSLILSWPANASGFGLHSTSNLSPAIWTSNSITPVIINGQNVVTNPMSGLQQYYRLSQ